MKIFTNHLQGIALDWAVAQRLGKAVMRSGAGPTAKLVHIPKRSAYKIWRPSSNPAQGGVIVQDHGLSVIARKDATGRIQDWWACRGDPLDEETLGFPGPTALIAAMRAFVSGERGEVDAIDIPQGLGVISETCELLPTPSGVTTRHDLAPELVQASLAHRIEQLRSSWQRQREQAHAAYASYQADVARNGARAWASPPPDPSSPEVQAAAAQFLEQVIAQETLHYGTVRVVERTLGQGSLFWLVYGDVDDAAVTSGTGPFDRFEAARDWFAGGGR